MKKIILLFALSIVCFLLTRCQIENLEESKKKFQQERIAEKRKERMYEKANLLHKGEDLSILERYKKSSKKTIASITKINGEIANNLEEPIALKSILNIAAVALDHPNEQNAATAYIKVGDVLFEAQEWFAKPQVAKKHDNDKYLLCGFNVNISTKQFEKGIYPVSVIVISNDKRHYYTSRKKFKVAIN